MWMSARCTTVDASSRAVTTTVRIPAAAKQASLWRPTARSATVRSTIIIVVIIIDSSLIMAVLRSRCGHYIFAL